jgi:hypothetical protein
MTPRLLLAIVGTFGFGWFLLSWLIVGTDAGDAIGEAMGAALGLLLFIAVIGAFRKGRIKSPKT